MSAGSATKKPKAGQKIDRRVARTRLSLQHALMSLMTKQGYDAVTVEDICENANVGRSTFYAHFTGKDDLRRSGFDDHLRKMLIERQREARESAPDESFAFTLAFFEHARDYLEVYRALVAKGGAPSTIAMIRKIVTDLVRRELAESSVGKSTEREPREAVVQFVAGAFMSLMTWWLDGGAKLPPTQVDLIFKRLVRDGIGRTQL
jgi:AcrR family transcriptional regulator